MNKIIFPKEDIWRLGFHLMPVTGWLNDPNGLCQFGEDYHFFFQYSMDDCYGNSSKKSWGHYTSRDLISWEYCGIAITPEKDFERNGIYTGSTITDTKMHIFYTGNVKLKGDYDYINHGRECCVIYTGSSDGTDYFEKECLIRHTEYPDNITCHVRDPKVWKHTRDGKTIYYMVLGARTKDDVGVVLLYASDNMKDWSFVQEIKSENPLGYMWECPDFFTVGGTQLLSLSPQGVAQQAFKLQNIYQSGYFPVGGEIWGNYTLGEFEEWDYGFDFYAPQTFEDNMGRRILVGWMGIADTPNQVNPTVKMNWQHALTVPREINVKGGKVYQSPVAELKNLRLERHTLEVGELSVQMPTYEVLVANSDREDFEIAIGKDLLLRYDMNEGIFMMEFQNGADGAGQGREIRRARMDHCGEVQILVDRSSVEVFLNGGEKVFTTRFYPQNGESAFRVSGKGALIQFWPLQSMQLTANVKM